MVIATVAVTTPLQAAVAVAATLLVAEPAATLEVAGMGTVMAVRITPSRVEVAEVAILRIARAATRTRLAHTAAGKSCL